MKFTVFKYISLYFSFFKNCLMREMEFRGNYILMVVASIFLNLYFLIYYMILVNRLGNNFLGWGRYEMLFFVATEVICHATFMSLCFYNVFSLPDQVRTGNFDFILIKPINARFMISTRNINFAAFTQALLGVGLAIYSLMQLNVKITLLKVTVYVAFIINSIFLMYLIGFCLMVLAFFFTKVSASGSILPYRGFFALYWFARRPEEIYSNVVVMFLTYCIPLTLIINLPAKWMVKAVSVNTLLWSLVVTPVFFALSHWFWKVGLKRYQSASS